MFEATFDRLLVGSADPPSPGVIALGVELRFLAEVIAPRESRAIRSVLDPALGVPDCPAEGRAIRVGRLALTSIDTEVDPQLCPFAPSMGVQGISSRILNQRFLFTATRRLAGLQAP